MSAAMTPERWKRLSELFERALEAPDADRAALIDRECAGDDDLAEQLRSLLALSPGADGFLENAGDILSPMLATPGESDADVFADGLVGKRVAGYRIIKQIGEGGMGVVYLAEQLKPRRTVALKIIRAGLATPSVVKRFEHEAHILGRLQHPGIAQIYEAGASGADEPSGVRGFFAMEYVRGRSLTDFARAERLGTREKLDLMARIADAVQHAHTRGVIHRDLKPSNILVDDHGQPKILDFGVARATDADVQVTTVRTSVGQLIGTLPYMSPEQVVGDPADVDTRSDVYALGVILYELLAGRLPHDLKSRSIPEAARIIRDDEPARISAIDKTLRGEVETIVLKALEKGKAQRYQSAAEFADDLRRFLGGEPIGARRDSSMYVLKKQLRRYRDGAVAAAVVLLALAAFAVYAARQSSANERLARLESLAKGEAIAARERAESEKARAEAERRRADAESERLRRELYFGRIGYAEAALAQGDVGRVRRLLRECPRDLRNWEWGFFRASIDQSDRRIRARLSGLGGGAFAQDGAVFVTFRLGEGAVVRDARTGAEKIRIAPEGGVWRAAISRNGHRLLLFGRTGEVYLQDLRSSGAATPTLWKSFDAPPRSGSFDPHAATIAIIDSQGVLEVFDAETGESRARIEGRALYTADIASDGLIVAGALDGEAVMVRAGAVTRLGAHDDMLREIAISPCGTLAASAGNDGAVRLWDLQAGSQRWVSRPFKNKAAAVAWSADGSTIFSGGTEARLEALDAATGQPRWHGLGHSSTILHIGTLPSGEAITTGIDGEVRWWTADSAARAERVVNPTGQPLLRTAPVDGGFLLLDWSNTLSRIDDAGHTAVIRKGDGRTGFGLATFAGAAVFTIGRHDVAAYTLPTVEHRWTTTISDAQVQSLAASPDGAYIAATMDRGAVHILSTKDGSIIASTDAHADGAQLALWSPDSARLYTAGVSGAVRVWNWSAADHTITMALDRAVTTPSPWTFSISPDGKQLLIGGDQEDAWLLDADTLEGRRLVGHVGAVYSSAFHPDGSRVVTGGFDNTTRIWDTATGAEVVVLRTHKYAVHGVCFDRAGRSLLSIAGDGLAILRRGGVEPGAEDELQ